MNRDERQLMELTAQSVFEQDRYFGNRAAGIENVLSALFVCGSGAKQALARLQIQADLLKEKGEFLIERTSCAPETGSEDLSNANSACQTNSTVTAQTA
jgi:hypothetical protein